MKTLFSALAMFLVSSAIFGQDIPAEPVKKGILFDTNAYLAIIALLLLLPVWMMSKTFLSAAKNYYADKLKSGTLKILVPLGFILMSTSLLAQEVASPESIKASNLTMTILLLCVIAAEILLLFFFAQKTRGYLQKMIPQAVSQSTQRDFLTWLKDKWAAMNFKPLEEEHKIDTGHSYDGIRELDNVIPPWFTTAFILTILVAAGYLYRYHIAKSGPTQIQEYKDALAMADLQHDEYLKTQANSIDESTVALMTGTDLDAGKQTFQTLCAVCHKSDGGGMVGPNLTDDYWIHGGALKDVFKTIKYGYPDKGMISWKDQLSPTQMAQVANYILTLKGTNPPDAKEKQGTLYVPEVVTADTTSASAMKPDTLTTK